MKTKGFTGEHHTQEALLCPELWDINNGLTLCVPCHDRTKKGRPHDKQ
jgi:hypothetical protein